MSSSPKFSIVTVTLNAVLYIEKCLISVVSQNCANVEYVVIDGGSADGTLELLQRYREHIDCLVSESDRGLYHAMNKGIRAATGDFIYFLNSDDYFCDSAILADVAEIIQADPSLDLVYGDVLVEQGGTLVRQAQVPQLDRESLCRQGFCHQALFARRDVLLRTGGFSEDCRIVADGDWLARALASGVKCRHIDRVVATIGSEGLSNMTNWRDEKRRYLRTNFTAWERFRWRKLPGILGRK